MWRRIVVFSVIQMTEQIVTIAGYPYQITYQENSTATDKWLLLHGFMGSRHDFDQLVTALPGTVMTIDLLGFGAHAPEVTAVERFTMASQIADLQAVLAAFHWEKVHLLGYSMGGRLALGFAIAHPELIATLILESATAGIPGAADRAARRQADAEKAQAISRDFERFVTNWEKLPLFASQQQLLIAQQQQMRRQRLRQRPENVAQSLLSMGTGAQPNFWPKLAQVTVNTLLIVGEKDVKFQRLADQMQQLLPNAQKVVIADAGHNVHFEQPNQVIARLKAHVSG